MRDLIFVLAMCAMLTYTFGRPHVGVLLWAWTALLIPNSFFFGFAMSFPINLIVALLTMVTWVLSKERVRVPVNGIFWVLLSLALLGSLSTFMTIGSSEVAYIEWDKFIKIIIFALVITGLMTSRFRLQALVLAIVFSLGFHGALEAMKYLLSGGGHAVKGPIASMLADNNHFALAMICTLPLTWFAIQETRHKLLRIGLAGVALLLLISIVGTYSRGAVIGLASVAAWAFVKSRSKAKFSLVLIPLVCALFFLAPEKWFSRIDTISTAEEDTSFLGRVVAWKYSALIALDRPLVGGGFHAVQNFGVVDRYYNNMPLLDFIPTPNMDLHFARAAHSIYFQVLGDLGFLGFGLFIALGVLAWRYNSAILRITRGRDDLLWANRLAMAFQFSMVGYYSAGAALSLAYFELMFIVFAMTSALYVLIKREATGKRSTGFILDNEKASRSLPA